MRAFVRRFLWCAGNAYPRAWQNVKEYAVDAKDGASAVLFFVFVVVLTLVFAPVIAPLYWAWGCWRHAAEIDKLMKEG